MAEEAVIKFTKVKWPSNFDHPSTFDKHIRTEFLKNNDGVLFGYNDLKDILMAYLQDECGACPDSLDFSIAFIGS